MKSSRLTLDSLPLTASMEKTPRRVTTGEKSLALRQESPKATASGSVTTKASENYPKISLTLSKMEEPRSAGLLSTLSVTSSCSMSLRCSLVSFVGVSTRT